MTDGVKYHFRDILVTLRGHFEDILPTSWKSWRKVDFMTMTKREQYIQTYQQNSELLRLIQEEMENELLEIVSSNVPPSQKTTDNINVLFKSFIPF